MLRTKAMREREQEREKRKYRYTLIRIRFPDGLHLQVITCLFKFLSRQIAFSAFGPAYAHSIGTANLNA